MLTAFRSLHVRNSASGLQWGTPRHLHHWQVLEFIVFLIFISDRYKKLGVGIAQSL
jgi:hypothetical protein